MPDARRAKPEPLVFFSRHVRHYACRHIHLLIRVDTTTRQPLPFDRRHFREPVILACFCCYTARALFRFVVLCYFRIHGVSQRYYFKNIVFFFRVYAIAAFRQAYAKDERSFAELFYRHCLSGKPRHDARLFNHTDCHD